MREIAKHTARIERAAEQKEAERIVALIVTHTDWVCRVARVLYLFYYFDMVATIVLLRVVVSDYTYQDIKDCGRILLG